MTPTSADLKVPTSQPRRVAGASRQRRCWAMRTLSSALTAPAPSRASTPARRHRSTRCCHGRCGWLPPARSRGSPRAMTRSVPSTSWRSAVTPAAAGVAKLVPESVTPAAETRRFRWPPARAARDRHVSTSGSGTSSPPAIAPALSSWLARFRQLKPLWLTNSSSGGSNRRRPAPARSCPRPAGSSARASGARASPSARRHPAVAPSGLRPAGGSSG